MEFSDFDYCLGQKLRKIYAIPMIWEENFFDHQTFQ